MKAARKNEAKAIVIVQEINQTVVEARSHQASMSRVNSFDEDDTERELMDMYAKANRLREGIESYRRGLEQQIASTEKEN